MNWSRLSNNNSEVQVYLLEEGSEVSETLRYYPLQESIRLNLNGEQRVFFIELHGFRNNEFRIKNEYGFVEGKIHIESQSIHKESGYIESNGNKINFSFSQDAASSEIIINRPASPLALAICDISLALNLSDGTTNKSNFPLYACFIWGLYWRLLSSPYNSSSSTDRVNAVRRENVLID
jgi:hypothetical protein